MFELSLDLGKTDIAALNTLKSHEKILRKAASRGLNKTARWLRTFLSEEVAKELELRIGLVRPGIVVITSRQSTLQTEIGLSRKSGVIKVKKLGKTRQTDTGVKAGKKEYEGAFVATMPNGHEGVFKRKGKARIPIREQVVVFTGRLAEHMESANAGLAQRQLKQIFEREYRHLARSIQ